MDFFRDVTVALRGPTGPPQTAEDTIAKLSDRLSPATLLADRRAAVLSLKGLSRDCKQEVGDRALPGLLDVLSNDAELDADIGKAVIETLHTLCEVDDNTPLAKDLGFKHTDRVLSNEKALYTMFSLLGDTNFYTRFATVQYLVVLLQNRRQVVQGYFLTAPSGAASVISALEDKREIIRHGEYQFREQDGRTSRPAGRYHTGTTQAVSKANCLRSAVSSSWIRLGAFNGLALIVSPKMPNGHLLVD
jgi:hypothetical protein